MTLVVFLFGPWTSMIWLCLWCSRFTTYSTFLAGYIPWTPCWYWLVKIGMILHFQLQRFDLHLLHHLPDQRSCHWLLVDVGVSCPTDIDVFVGIVSCVGAWLVVTLDWVVSKLTRKSCDFPCERDLKLCRMLQLAVSPVRALHDGRLFYLCDSLRRWYLILLVSLTFEVSLVKFECVL